MKREGAVEENLTGGTEQRVSKRPEDAELVKPAETAEPSEALSPEEQEKVQMRRQQRQFQAEHAEDNDCLLYTSVWGVVNLMEGYGNDNPGAKSQGIKQLMAGGGLSLIHI